MQDQMSDRAFVVFDEGDLRVHHFKEEFGFRFGKQLEFRLSRRLSHQTIAFPGHREDEVGTELVLADVSVKDFLIDFDRHTLAGDFVFLTENDRSLAPRLSSSHCPAP
jgi:hypothetical protein